MQFEFRQRSLTGNDALDVDIRDLQIVETAGGAYLLAINGVNGGLSSFDVFGSTLSFEDGQMHSNATLLTGDVTGFATDSARLLLGGTFRSDMQSYSVGANGDISTLQSQALPSETSAGLRDVQHVSLMGGEAAVYAITSDGALAGWRLRDEAEPMSVPSVSDLSHSRVALLETARFSDSNVLLVAEGNPGRLTTYTVDPVSGAVAQAAQFGASDGLATATPTGLLSFEAYGTPWAVMGAAGTNSLSLFSISEGGELQFSDQVADTAHTRFQGVSAIETIQIGDHRFLVAAGQDDGLSVLRLLPEGRLIHVATITHELGYGLDNVSALELTTEGGNLQIFAASQVSGGIAQFTVPLSDIGNAMIATSGSLSGSGAGDLLIGRQGATVLTGGGGDDMLVSQSAGDLLTGGAGQDRFVIHEVDGVVEISDFTAGEDRLDLSLFAALRNTGQLGFSMTATGAVLSYLDTEIRVRSRSGDGLELTDVWPEAFLELDRLGLGDVSSDGVVYGSGSDDVLAGTEAADDIQGQSGNDQIDGRGGNDVLRGGDGRDLLQGGLGADTLFGGLGDDDLQGGEGADRLYGEQGNDRISGGAADDEIWGAYGDDVLRGNAGADQISGGEGHDELRGGGGTDLLIGGQGADVVKGNGGDDTLFGNDGVDTLKGGRGNDRLEGGAADDLLKGKLGNDTLLGQEGHDTLKGGAGADQLDGGAGNDRLGGGTGHDLYLGDSGADHFMFKRMHGSDRIADFSQGEDVIDLRFLGQGGIKRFGNLDITQQGTDVLIQTGLGEIWLSDTFVSDLDGGDFLF